MNIGIIGSGAIVERFIEAANLNGGININSIYSRDKNSQRARYMADTYAIKNVYDDYDQMLLNDELDFIYIASPNSLHYGYSLKALEAGKNVICEKPFTSTGKEALHLFETAKKNGLMIFEAIVNVHMPNYKLVKKLLPQIGQVRGVQLNYSQYSSRYDKFLAGESPNVFNPQFSGGALMDINIYNVHFVLGLFGQPDKYSYFPNITRGIDTSGIAVFHYPGFFASLVGAKDAESDNSVIIQGEKGLIYVGNGANGCEYVELKLNKEHRGIKYNEQYQTSELFYEVEEFKNIFESKDYSKCYELCQYSVSVIELVENLRKSAGLVFAADK
ncbi:Gfo/Idh/MocA family oxidoreductase [Tyzzerella sp. OttesenSCG-928-J15]|nr:Gfo/Idh/MocA family oxidoreductase [Tyzzerella sp. OttesenSCG-928-J15]